MTTHRKCGDCQLCCKLMPTEEIDKPANVRCQHQCRKGCRIYAHKPLSCSLWNCRWLVDDDMSDQPRPDRSHLVVDMMPDVIRMTPDNGGPPRTLPVIVAWLDPAYPDAWKSEAFGRYVKRQVVPVLVRLGSAESVGVLFPPAFTGLDHVVLRDSKLGSDMPTTLVEKAMAVGGTLDHVPDPAAGVSAVTLRMPDGTTKTIAASTKLDVLQVPNRMSGATG